MKVKSVIITSLALGIVGSTIAFNSIVKVKADTTTSSNVTKAVANTPKDQVMISDDKQKIMSAHDASGEGMDAIKQNAPFKVVTPDETKLTKGQLTGAFMNKVKNETNERNVDFFYNTPSGQVHIWESNLNEQTAEKNPLNAPGYNEKVVKIGNQDWYFTPHLDDKDLLIFTAKLNGNFVQVSGKVPYNELVDIISTLK